MSLGRIALNFAQLEGCAIWLVDAVGTESEIAIIRDKQSFVHRNELASLLVVYKGLDTDITEDWTQLLGELNGAAKMRNNIFHNPASVPIGKGFDEHDGIILLRKGENIVLGLGDVQDFDVHLGQLLDRMHSLLERTPRN